MLSVTKYSLALIQLFFVSFICHSQTKVSEQCDKLMSNGAIALSNCDYSLALKYFTEAESLAEKENLKDKFFSIHSDLGIINKEFSMYGEALGHYLKALDIAYKSDSKNHIALVLNNIGNLFVVDDYNRGLEYFEKAYALTKFKENYHLKPLIALNIADVYNKLHDYKRSQKYLFLVKDLPTNEDWKEAWTINYAESLLLEGRLDEAQQIMERVLKLKKSWKNDYIYCQILELLSRIYYKQHKIDKSINYARRALHVTGDIKDKAHVYNHLSEIYFSTKDIKNAALYKDSILWAKDSLFKLINQRLYEGNKVKLKILDYQNKLNVKEERQSAERKLFAAGIFCLLLLSLFIYTIMQSRIQKQKQEKIISENQQRIFALELQSLRNSIEEKNRKLSTKALYLSERNNLLEQIINSLSGLPAVNSQHDLSEYIKTLKSHLKSDDQWDEFIKYFEDVNPKFIRTLATNYPELNSSDIRFICYVFMNLDTKEIANIFNITYNAAKKRKARIKEKMGIDNESSLYEYLIKTIVV